MASVMFTFVVVEYPQGRSQAEQFIVGQTKFPTARMLMAEVIIDGKCFVEKHSIRFQCVHQRRKQRTMQIEEHDYGFVTV